MTYLFYETPDDLMPQVLTEEQFLQYLLDKKISVLSRLYVPDTRSFVPALEHALLVARANGIDLDRLPSSPGLLTGKAAVVALPRGPFDEQPYSGPSPYPSPAIGTGSPRRTPPSAGFGVSANAAAANTSASAARNESSPGAAATAAPTNNRQTRRNNKVGAGNAANIATSANPATRAGGSARSPEEYFNQVDSLIEKYTVWYSSLLVRHQIALLLIPLAGIGFFMLRRVRRDERNLLNRLSIIGINRADWKMMIERNIMLSRRQATLRPLTIYATIASLVLFVLIARSPVVQDSVSRLISGEAVPNVPVSAKKSTGTVNATDSSIFTGAAKTTPEAAPSPVPSPAATP